MYQSQNQRQFARHLRRNQTEAEYKLWRVIRKRQIAGCRFRRQYAIGPYIADFECFERKLVIELDGGQHNLEAQREHDAQRTAYLEKHGYCVLRFWNSEIMEELDAVVERIAEVLMERGLGVDAKLGGQPHSGRHPHPDPPPKGEGELLEPPPLEKGELREPPPLGEGEMLGPSPSGEGDPPCPPLFGEGEK